MPFFFFHLHQAHEIVRDEEGAEYSDWEAAYAAGVCSAREMVAHALLAGVPLNKSLDRRYEVETDGGEAAMTICFRAAVEVANHKPADLSDGRAFRRQVPP